jgi:hypothetical protein
VSQIHHQWNFDDCTGGTIVTPPRLALRNSLQIDSTLNVLKPGDATARLFRTPPVRTMDVQVKAWKRAADELAAGPALDYRAAVELAGQIARRQDADAGLQQAAAQALPNLRAALATGADRRSKAIAERRFAVVRDVLHLLTLPRFGKRESPDKVLTPEEHHRRLLGLPLDRRLFGPEINAAYKQAAKRVHPDAGGDQRDFLALSQARDALMKRI